VVLVGLSPPLELWREDGRSSLEILNLSLNNNLSTAHQPKVTKVAMVVSWTQPSSMLNNTRWSKRLTTHTKLTMVLVLTKKLVTFKFPDSLMSLPTVPQP
jgi:hypothetical protein